MADNTHSLNLDTGATDYASIANASSANLEISGSLTVEAWIRPTNTAGGWSKGYFVSKWASPTGGYYFALNNGLTPRFLCYGLTTNNVVEATGVSVVNNQWYHLAGVYDSSAGKLRVYVNGVLQNEVTASGSIGDGNANFYVGLNSNNTAEGFEGDVQQVRVWNVARTTAQIKDNMFRDVTGDSNLQGYWKLNNNYTDSSANGYNLTASGSPSFSTTVPFPTYRSLNPVELNSTSLLSDANLKAYWRLENLNDSKSTNNLTGDTTPTAATAKFNNGYDFDSGFDCIYKTTMDFAPFTSGGGASAWIYPDTKGAGAASDYGRVFNGAGALFISAESGSNYKLRFYHQFGTTWGRWETNDYIGTYGNWVHVVVNYNNGSTANDPTIYINGVQVAITEAVTPAGTTVTTVTDMYIGNNTNASGVRAWDGKLDDISFFNRALTATEIFDLYTGIPASSGMFAMFR